MTVYISICHGKREPYIKVSRVYGDTYQPGNTFSVTIEDDPEILGTLGDIRARDISKILDFISKNRSLLEEYWYQEEEVVLMTNDMIVRLQHI